MRDAVVHGYVGCEGRNPLQNLKRSLSSNLSSMGVKKKGMARPWENENAAFSVMKVKLDFRIHDL
jgi:hypothetical protein